MVFGEGPVVFVDDLDEPALPDHDRHHLQRVRRVQPGATITVGDGRGGWRLARFGDQLEPITPVERDPAPDPPITVGFALVKGARPELIVQKLTEAGVEVIRPFTATRSVVRWDERKAAVNLERLRKVAREAAMQCRRTWLPAVEPLASFDAVSAGAGIALAHPGGAQLTLATPTLLVGPEGGWTDAERVGHATAGLGPHVLRAETAAIAAGVLLVALRSGIVRQGPPRAGVTDGDG